MASFSDQIKRAAASIQKQLEMTVTVSFSDLATKIVSRTPIGDPSLWASQPPANYVPGTLINNWFTSIGSQSTEGMRAQDKSAAGTLRQIASVSKLAPGEIVFFSNPSPHAFRIEFDSWSTQAPAGMTRLTANEWGQIVNEAARKVKS